MRKLMIGAVALMALAACEREQGVGFTGIGPAASKASAPHYGLDFPGLGQGQ